MTSHHRNGRLWYLIGPSGAGKDSLLQTAAERLADLPKLRFARRYITRPADAGGENHIAISEQDFNAKLADNAFLLHWRSHGYAYGIGKDVQRWLDEGCDVCINGSRGYLPTARRLVPALYPILIRVSHERLLERLLKRGRETVEQIEARLRRTDELAPARVTAVIDNNGPIGESADALCRLILTARGVDDTHAR